MTDTPETQSNGSLTHERLLFIYTSALERGDMHTISLILQRAANDVRLGDMIEEINAAYVEYESPPVSERVIYKGRFGSRLWTLAAACVVALAFVGMLVFSLQSDEPDLAAVRLSLNALAPISPANAAQLVPVSEVGRGRVYDMAWSPDGLNFALGTTSGVYVYRADILDAGRQRVDNDAPVRAVAYTPDGKMIAGLSGDAVHLWDSATGAHIRSMAFEGAHTLLAPADDTLITSRCSQWIDNAQTLCERWTLLAVDLDDGTETRLQSGVMTQPVLSNNGNWMALPANDGSGVYVWSMAQLLTSAPVFLESGISRDNVARDLVLPQVTFGDDNLLLQVPLRSDDALQGLDSQLLLWSLADDDQPLVRSVRLLDHASNAFTVTASGTIYYLEMRRGFDSNSGNLLLEPLATFDQLTAYGLRSDQLRVLDARWNAGGTQLLIRLPDSRVQFWDMSVPDAPVLLADLEGYASTVTEIAFAPDMPQLALAASESVGVWQYADNVRLTGTRFAKPIGERSRIDGGFAFAPDGTFTYADTSLSRSSFGYWSARSGYAVESAGLLSTADATAMAYTAEGMLVAFFADGGRLLRHRPRSTEAGRVFTLQLPFPTRANDDSLPDVRAAFSADGSLLALDGCLTDPLVVRRDFDDGRGCPQRAIVLVDTATGDTLGTIETALRGPGTGLALAQGTDNAILLAASGCLTFSTVGDVGYDCVEAQINVWQISAMIAGDANAPVGMASTEGWGALAFSPDGRLLANVYRGQLRLIDLETRQLRLNQPVDADDSALAFSPDGRLLGVGDAGIVTLYGVPGTADADAAKRVD